MTQAILIITNVPDSVVAGKISRQLVENRLAACVNVLPPVHSVYSWQGAIEEATEITLLIKTMQNLYPKVEQKILELHPYEVPEVIALPMVNGLPSYLGWIAAETSV